MDGDEKPEMPAWMDDLVRAVSEAMTAHALPGPVGLRYSQEEGEWNMVVYPLPLELVGGRHDGEVVSPGFCLDLGQVLSAFTRVDDLYWQAHSGGDQDAAPYISIEGEYTGQQVWLRVLAFAPDDEGPGETFDTNQR
jgi:hypothetical protein